MLIQDSYKDAHVQFGIDELYIHDGFELNILQKLQQRAVITLDSNDTIIQKNVNVDMILVFKKRVPKVSFIYRFLEFLQKNPDKQQDCKKLHTLLNEEELFEAVKTEKYILVTYSKIVL